MASVNDAFRERLGQSDFGVAVPGKLEMPPGISSLPPNILNEIWMAIRDYDFNKNPDHFGDHSFSAFNHPVAGRVLWNIDCYEDISCEDLPEFPEDPKRSYRILTIWCEGDKWS